MPKLVKKRKTHIHLYLKPYSTTIGNILSQNSRFRSVTRVYPVTVRRLLLTNLPNIRKLYSNQSHIQNLYCINYM